MNAKLPSVCVVVPSLNRAEFIASTIDSVLVQDYPLLECIVVDAGSDDGTIDILRGYGDRIRWVSEPDDGPFDAINKGWAMSTSDVVAWLNADDTYVSGAVSRAMDVMACHPAVDVVHGDCATLSVTGEVDRVWGSDEWDYVRSVASCTCTIEQPAAFMRRRAIERVGGLHPIATLDFDLWLRMSAAGATFMAIPDHLANAVDHPGRITNRPEVMVPAVVETIRRAVRNPAAPMEVRKLARRATSSAYAHGFYFVGHRRWTWVARCVAGAIQSDPSNSRAVLTSLGNSLGQPGSPRPLRLALAAGRGRRPSMRHALPLLQLGVLLLLWADKRNEVRALRRNIEAAHERPRGPGVP